MSECTNPDVQDLLPEFVAGALPDAERVEVEVHLSACALCREDVALLETVQRVRPAAPALDIAAIVAALPAPPAARREPPVLRVLTATADVPPSMARTGRRSEPAHRERGTRSWWSGPGLRVAAVLTLVALGGLSLEIARRGQSAITDGDVNGQVVLTDDAFVVAEADLEALPRPYEDGVTPVVPVVAVAPSVLPVQELPEYSDDELALLLARLEAWDGSVAVDPPDPSLPPSSEPPDGDSMTGGAR